MVDDKLGLWVGEVVIVDIKMQVPRARPSPAKSDSLGCGPAFGVVTNAQGILVARLGDFCLGHSLCSWRSFQGSPWQTQGLALLVHLGRLRSRERCDLARSDSGTPVPLVSLFQLLH